jgi:hypothetical protein
MYILMNNQQIYRDRDFQTKEEVRDYLANYHSVGVLGTEALTLEDLLMIGDWHLLDTSDIPY